jgi:hypothetical protein
MCWKGYSNLGKKLSKAIQSALLENELVEAPDSVKQAIDAAKELIIEPHEESLAAKLVELAFQMSKAKGYRIGIALAAAFDLFVTAGYYENVAHTKWYYCPEGEPLSLYPFLNACPRCLLKPQYEYQDANKPTSAIIGKTTSHALPVFLNQLFIRSGRRVKIYIGKEPVDMLILDEEEKTILLSEVKASPLTTLALAFKCEKETETTDEGIRFITTHTGKSPILGSAEIYIFLPISQGQTKNYRLVSLGIKGEQIDKTWGYKGIEQVLDRDDTFFNEYLDFWAEAFEAYAKNDESRGSFFWFTSACGVPSKASRPLNWPNRPNGGPKTISDGKTSVGMDRTDDIKKGTYQVLKVGVVSKPTKSDYQVKTALISNIHAVRHYEDYLEPLEEVVWTLDEGEEKDGKKIRQVKKAGDLDPETPIYNLWDGIITLTEHHIRDEWIKRTFSF